MDLGELSPQEKKQVAAQIDWFRQYRTTLQYGTFLRIPTRRKDLFSWAAGSPARDRAVVLLAQTLCRAAPPADILTVPGLRPDARILQGVDEDGKGDVPCAENCGWMVPT